MSKPLKALTSLVTLFTLSTIFPAQALDRAVIVGVNTYPYLTNGNLKGARNDALKFKDFVKRELGLKDSQITLLLDKQATQDNVVKAIVKDLIRGTRPGDRAIFYFAGHGTRINDRSGDEKDRKDEIVMFSDVGKKGARGALIDDEFSILFEKIPDRRVLLVVDSCHSGTITRSINGTDDDVAARTILMDDAQIAAIATPANWYDDLPPTPNSAIFGTRSIRSDDRQAHMSVWSAVAQDQVALESRSEGIFTKNIIAGMRNKRADLNRNGTVSNAELLRYVRQQSTTFCRRSRLCAQKNRGRLTPQFSGNARQAALLTGSAVIVEPAPLPKPIIEPAPDLAKPKPDPKTVTPDPKIDPPVASNPPKFDPALSKPNPTIDPKPQGNAHANLTTPGSDPAPKPVDPPKPPQNDPQASPTPPYNSGADDSAKPTIQPPGDLADTNPSGSVPAPLNLNDTGQLTDMFLSQDNPGLDLKIIPGTRLVLGKLLRIELMAKSAGQLVLFDYNPKGELFQIFPSRFSTRDARNVAAGSVFNIPEAVSANGRPLTIRAARPTGRGHMIALLLEDDINAITDLLPAHTDLKPIPNGDRHLSTIADALMQWQSGANGPRAAKWSSVVLPYQIVE